MDTIPFSLKVVEGSAASILMRINDDDENNVVQDYLEEITVNVFDTTTKLETYDAVLPIQDHIYDALQNDKGWNKDSLGWNFRHIILGDAFPDGDRTYQVEYQFTQTNGVLFRRIGQVTTLEAYQD